LALNEGDSARTLLGQNSTQKPQALHRSTVIVTTPFAIPTSFQHPAFRHRAELRNGVICGKQSRPVSRRPAMNLIFRLDLAGGYPNSAIKLSRQLSLQRVTQVTLWLSEPNLIRQISDADNFWP
jgi:hypothetical protein